MTLQLIIKPNVQTKLWNSTSESSATINKITGIPCYHLRLAEFTYNNTPSSTTDISPFFANKGYHPNLTIHPKRDLASTQAKNLVVNLDKLHQELKTAIAEAQLCYQGPADLRRMFPLLFEAGQQAFVKAKFF